MLNRHNYDAISHTASDAMGRVGEAEWLAEHGIDAKELIAYLRTCCPDAMVDGLACFILGVAVTDFVHKLETASA